MSYNFKKKKKKWRKKWEDSGIYKTPTGATKDNKYYILPQLPYPSGQGLHTGHAEVYVACDIMARYKRMTGSKVLQVIGWDSFGLPAENYAIKTNVHPKISTNQNVENFRKQIKELGASVDWDREVGSHNSDYYKWTQWFFKLFYERGLAYKKLQNANWCESCKTVLANDQVTNENTCERCSTEIIQKPMDQWFIRITDYADRLYDDLDKVDWPSETIKRQRDWIGRSEGAEVDFIVGDDQNYNVKDSLKFTPELTTPVKQGKKTSTIRLESKNLEIGDYAKLITRFSKTETQSFAIAKINNVRKLKLKDIPINLEGHESYVSHEEKLADYKKYYGESVTNETEFTIYDFEVVADILTVFTTRPDTIFGATFMVLAPEHPLVGEFLPQLENAKDVKNYIEATKKKTELDRQIEKEKTGVELKGIKAVNPVNGKEIPIFIADYVLMGYGTGAIMAVPAHDERDFEFAKKFGVEMINVILPSSYLSINIANVHPAFSSKTLENETVIERKERWQKNEIELIKKGTRCYLGEGFITNSDFLNGLSIDEAKSKIISHLEEKGIGRRKKVFKLRDWCVSRQRFWGAPIPIVYDEKGSPHILDTEDLPVLLPDDVDFVPTGRSPLTDSVDFQKGVEEKFGKGWRREVDTLDTFMCSSWYYFRYLDPKNDKAFASPESLKAWMPVDFYIGGAEHVNGHLLFSRFFTKVLFDAGYIDFDEPFLKHIHQGMVLGEDGRKMSKRWGNVINPTDVVEKYGADTMRVYEMFMGPLEQDKSWNDSAVQGVHRFITRVVNIAVVFKDKETGELSNQIHKLIKNVTKMTENIRYNTAIAEFMKTLNDIEKNPNNYNKSDFETFLILFSPYAPFICEELWEFFGNKNSISLESWPKYDEAKTIDDEVEIVVQVNGKLRGSFKSSKDASKEELLNTAKSTESVLKFIEPGIKKEIVVPGKLVNFVV